MPMIGPKSPFMALIAASFGDCPRSINWRDAFDYDNGVIHDDADGEDDGEEREQIDAETHHRHGGEGADDRDRHRGRRDKRGPPILEKDHDDEEHEEARFAERLINFVNRIADEGRGIERDRVFEVFGKIFGQPFHRGVHGGGGVERVCFRKQEDGDAAGGFAVVIEELAVGLRAQFDARDVAQSRDLAVVIRLDDDLLEVRGIIERAVHVDGELEILRRAASAASRSGPR